VQVSHAHNLKNWLVRALNARGWAYRNRGQLDQALQDYLEAYQLGLELNDLWRTASILNNMGYVNALKGNRQLATENCLAALDMWQELDFGRGIAATYSTLGEVARRFDQVVEAMNYYTKALDIFTDEQDVEWMSIVRSGRAIVYLLQEKLEQAQEDLSWAFEHGPGQLKPRLLHTQALLYWAKKQLKRARQQLERCRTASQKIGDQIADYKSFVDLVDLAWEFGQYERWLDFTQEFQEKYDQYTGEVALRLRGSYLRKIGDLAICHGDYADALSAYQEGLTLIAKHEIHEPYSVAEQIKKIERRVQTCTSPEQLSQLGRDLAQFWKQDTDLVTKSPRVLAILNRWERKGEPS